MSENTHKRNTKRQWGWWVLYALTFALISFFVFIVLDLAYPFRVNVEYSKMVTDKNGKVLHAFLTKDDKWRMKTELEEISPELKTALLFKEDQYFYRHPGINPLAIGRAIWNNTSKQKRTSGASTITMQVARLLNPKKRTYQNKVIEMFNALQLEWHYSKAEIFQFYLNLIPFGGNIEGIKSASILYMEKTPEQLSLSEIACLSIIPNRPNSLTLGKHNELIAKEKNRWLERYKEAAIFEQTVLEDALTEPVQAFRHDSPKLAPHFCYRMKRQYPNKDIIKTTLDYNAQLAVERKVRQYSGTLKYNNIQNAAVFVLDNENNEVVAYVGSADFKDKKDSGQVDGIRAIRSPGSTLKPLIYAMAFEEGLLTPQKKILDVPQNFGGFMPKNFDEKYQGQVTVSYALAQSLNIPAVSILEQLKEQKLIDKLKNAQFKQIARDEKKLGLSLALGGCGVSLEELTTLYSAFAHEGQYHSTSWLQEEKSSSFDFLNPAAVFMTTDILTKVERPDLPNIIAETVGLPRIAWKTGTSYGRKDAWSIGYNSQYTIGVWVGNFSGQGVPELTGSTKAAPLLFEVFNLLDRSSKRLWNVPPENIDYRWVCSESGVPAEETCPHTVMDAFVPLVSDTKKCTHLKPYWVSMDKSESYCSRCLPREGYQRLYYDNPHPALAAYYRAALINYNPPPPHHIDCEHSIQDNAPKITSLVDQLQYLLAQTDNNQLMLTCQTANDVDKVSWFVNDVFLKTVRSDEDFFFSPKAGKVKISCADDKGRNSDISIDVKYY